MQYWHFLLALTIATGCGKTVVEPGVSRTLALERSAHISDIRYDLVFRIHEARTEPVEGMETLTFTLDSRRRERERIIGMTKEDLLKWLPALRQASEDGTVCVVGYQAVMDKCEGEGLVISEL